MDVSQQDIEAARARVLALAASFSGGMRGAWVGFMATRLKDKEFLEQLGMVHLFIGDDDAEFKSGLEALGFPRATDQPKRVQLVRASTPPGFIDLAEQKVEPQPLVLTRTLFENFIKKGTLMRVGDEETLVGIPALDDVRDGEVVFYKRDGDSFDGFAQAESRIQTLNMIETIRNGEDPTLHAFKNAAVELEWKAHPAKGLEPPKKWGFPINPDALLRGEDRWLLLESKHKLTPKHIKIFEDKVDFVRANRCQEWVVKGQPPPAQVVGAMCSVAPLPQNVSTSSSLLFYVRQGLKYLRVR